MTKLEKRDILKQVKEKLGKDENLTRIVKNYLGIEDTEDFMEDFPELKEILDSIGENPVKEPDLAYDLDEMSKKSFLFDFANVLRDKKDVDLKDVPTDVALKFCRKVASKVNSFKDDNGAYKYIDKFSKVDFSKMNIYKVGALRDIMEEKNKQAQQMLKGYDEDIDDVEEFNDEFEELSEKYEEKVNEMLAEILGIKISNWDKWSKDLLLLNVLAEAGLGGISYNKENL